MIRRNQPPTQRDDYSRSGSQGAHEKTETARQAIALRLKTCVAIAIVVALGLASKFYCGPGADWVNNFGPASVFYVVMIVFGLFALHPRRKFAVHYAALAFAVTCIVEFTQLIHVAWLDELRSQTFWKLLLGTSFTWWDFPAYLVGAAAGWWGVRYVLSPSKLEKTNNSPRPDTR